MDAARLSVWLDAYGKGLKDALQLAARQGYRLTQGGSGTHALDPRELTGTGRRHLHKYLQDLGLGLDAISADTPGLGLADPARADERLDHFRQVLDLCRDLRVQRAGVSLSGFEDPRTAPLAGQMLAAVADLADRYGITVSVFDRQARPEANLENLRAAGCPHLRAALDTASLAGVPLELSQPGGLVGAVYLRDVRRRGERFEEVPFGSGEVDFAGLLASLEAAGRDPSLVVRPEAPSGVDALRQGREYIETLFDRVEPR